MPTFKVTVSRKRWESVAITLDARTAEAAAKDAMQQEDDGDLDDLDGWDFGDVSDDAREIEVRDESGRHVHAIPGAAETQPAEPGTPRDIIARLVAWASNTGGWEAPVWRDAEAFLAAPATSTPLDALLGEAMAYEAEAFDADEEVDGGDIVGWFAEWRHRVNAAMGA